VRDDRHGLLRQARRIARLGRAWRLVNRFLRRVSVPSLEFGKQKAALLCRSRPAHDRSPVESLFLTRRRLGVRVGTQIGLGERFGVPAVSIESQK